MARESASVSSMWSRHRHRRVQHVDLPEARNGSAVADDADLARLALAIVERAVQLVGPASAETVARAPEVRRARLIRDVAQHARDLPFADLEERLPAELEVVALLVDRPAAVAVNQDALVDARHQLIERGDRK